MVIGFTTTYAINVLPLMLCVWISLMARFTWCNITW